MYRSHSSIHSMYSYTTALFRCIDHTISLISLIFHSLLIIILHSFNMWRSLYFTHLTCIDYTAALIPYIYHTIAFIPCTYLYFTYSTCIDHTTYRFYKCIGSHHLDSTITLYTFYRSVSYTDINETGLIFSNALYGPDKCTDKNWLDQIQW